MASASPSTGSRSSVRARAIAEHRDIGIAVASAGLPETAAIGRAHVLRVATAMLTRRRLAHSLLLCLALAACGKTKPQAADGGGGSGGASGSTGGGGGAAGGSGGTAGGGSGGVTDGGAGMSGAAGSGGGGGNGITDGGADAGGASGTGGPTDAHADCGAILLLPPIVTVAADDDGSPICDATFTVLTGPDGGASTKSAAASVCGSNVSCPNDSQDAGPPVCRFQLFGLVAFPVESYGVQVSRAGFEPVTITVTTGAGDRKSVV
jgi:hypothetical protein